ncbi:NAD(P)-dependent alcohol dehydrogenase [Devosia algicola]|uniref:NAD(P)-dependent alcohol dehydrogenase n=1 Tax=Devosia algicola TaxID=3026418 RepID=A0ABY7YL94_9HYPH|nr:NAD(P)-dependent alcohol dehydrogenase [Devosia algicola]WDR02054.1 NAD(P)-dependent alcohol dehydrogenase [Devosia algicola]
MPEGMRFEEAAAIPFGGLTARCFWRQGKLAAGHKVLVIGASGAVGSAAVQLAHIAGAHVTAVCSAANADLVSRLGADEVIDYNSEDFTKGSERYDIIFDTVGSVSFAEGRKALTPEGVFMAAIARKGDMGAGFKAKFNSKQRLIAGSLSRNN